jgi:hypothetical protein
MRTHRFGRKIKLPATIAIKHQIRMLMALDEVKKAEAHGTLPLSALGHGDKSVQIPLTPT